MSALGCMEKQMSKIDGFLLVEQSKLNYMGSDTNPAQSVPAASSVA